jgi:hypothetical protein
MILVDLEDANLNLPESAVGLEGELVLGSTSVEALLPLSSLVFFRHITWTTPMRTARSKISTLGK